MKKKNSPWGIVLIIIPLSACLLLGSLSVAGALYRLMSNTLLYLMLAPRAAAQAAAPAAGASAATPAAKQADPQPARTETSIITLPDLDALGGPEFPEARAWHGRPARDEHGRHAPARGHGHGATWWRAHRGFFTGMLMPPGPPAEGFSTTSRQ